jgi:hypothetical protein
MLIKVMATCEDLAKNFFESNLKKKGNIAFLDISDFGSISESCNGYPIPTHTHG